LIGNGEDSGIPFAFCGTTIRNQLNLIIAKSFLQARKTVQLTLNSQITVQHPKGRSLSRHKFSQRIKWEEYNHLEYTTKLQWIEKGSPVPFK
jgi:hypothetical protein